MSEASELKMGVVEVIPPVQQGRRRKFTADEKRFFLEKAQAPGDSISSVARRYGLPTSLRLPRSGTDQ